MNAQALTPECIWPVGAKLGELDLTIALRERRGFALTKDVIALGSGQAEMEAHDGCTSLTVSRRLA